MKTVKNPVVTISADGKTGSLTFEIADVAFSNILTSRISHGHANAENMSHRRYIQSSNAAVFVSSSKGKVAFENEFMAAIAAAVDPLTTFAPVLKKTKLPNSVSVASETPVKYQWQISDAAFPKATQQHTPAPAAVWTDIPDAALETLDESKVPEGKWARCMVSNASGSVFSKPIQNVTAKK